MTFRWISQHIWTSRLTIHLASCFVCNDGRGANWYVAHRSLAAGSSHQWHGPFTSAADSLATAELLAAPRRATIRECHLCMPQSQLMAVVSHGAAAPSGLLPVTRTPMRDQKAIGPEFWIYITGCRTRATVHFGFCGIANRGPWRQTANHGTNVTAPIDHQGWYGPYPGLAEAHFAARHFQQALGIIIRDCLRCVRVARLR
jgi:hypothetical protein